MRRGQSALEFLILAGFMFIASSMIFSVLNAQAEANANLQHQQEVSGAADMFLAEVVNAHRVHDGYSRTFRLPPLIESASYRVQLRDNREAVFQTQTYEYVLFLPANVTLASGSTYLSPGEVLISKQNGKITMSVPPLQ